MRKSIDGLASIVKQKFHLGVFTDTMFVFHNHPCDKVKMLYWDGTWFCLLYKHMEKGCFCFPRPPGGEISTFYLLFSSDSSISPNIVYLCSAK